MNYIKNLFIFTLLLNLNNINAKAIDEKFHVCGSYCGPTWCNNKWLEEEKCDTSVNPEYHKITGYSCADKCCKNHDECCGQENKKNCNKEIVNCLKNCNPLSLTCTINYLPVPAGIIESAMNIVETWCCGSPC